MSPLEKAAKAAYDKNPSVPRGPDFLGNLSWEELKDFRRQMFVESMRAALAALMEPTQEMMDAGEGYQHPDSVWKAMLTKVIE